MKEERRYTPTSNHTHFPLALFNRYDPVYTVNYISPGSGVRGLASPWWRHQMETFSASLARCEGNSPFTGELPSQRPVTWSFDVFFDLRLNKQLSKQSIFQWFETLLCPLWRHCSGGHWYVPTLSPDCRYTILIASWLNGQSRLVMHCLECLVEVIIIANTLN